jgi:hypothetical protein
VGRGLAVGDLDNDGAADFVVNNNNGPFRVFVNAASTVPPWIGLRVMAGRRDAHGALIELRRKGAPTLWRRVRPDGSYLSANDPRVLIGLGRHADVDSVVVHWPDGEVERFVPPPLKQYTTLRQGEGAERRKP